MPTVPPPMEFLELESEGELVTRVLRHVEGTTVIKTPTAPEGKEIRVLRLYVPPEDKPTEPKYWDVSATLLMPSLLEWLPTVEREKRWIRIRAFGFRPRTRFQLEVMPAGVGGPAFTGVRR